MLLRTMPAPALEPVAGVAHGVCPHSEEAGSIGEELILRASHDHVLYKEDNKKLYYLLAEACVYAICTHLEVVSTFP